MILFFRSIEEKMLEIQDKKKKLIAGAFRQSDNQRRQQRIQDIRDIFGLWNFTLGMVLVSELNWVLSENWNF